MLPYTYLLINFSTVVVCFIFSFDKRIRFYRLFSAFLKAGMVAAIPFIAWDIWFTKTGVWWFNTDYTLHISIAGLPVEEWLFFICIPFSCVFTYFCLDKFFNLNPANKFNSVIVWIMLIICLALAIVFNKRIYPFITAVFTAITLSYLYFIAKADWIGKASLVYLILLPGFLIINGVLTGTGLNSPIVNYNHTEILNVRIMSIPVEDWVYGYAQFMLVIYFFKLFQEKKNNYEK